LSHTDESFKIEIQMYNICVLSHNVVNTFHIYKIYITKYTGRFPFFFLYLKLLVVLMIFLKPGGWNKNVLGGK